MAPYWILPIVSAAVWLGFLLGMLLSWIEEGRPHYASMEARQSFAYISDIGAQRLKPLFIAGACVSCFFLDASFLAERWLRHRAVLTPNATRSEKVLSVLGIVWGVAGTAGLILLSIFDTLRHPRMHDGFLLLFMAGYVLCAAFTCAEYQRMGIHMREHRILRISFWIKLSFVVVEVILAIAFGSLMKAKKSDQAAALEWTIAFIFTFWILSFTVDLVPASTRLREKLRIKPAKVEEAEQSPSR